jgi:hypothetical protein
MLLVGPNSAPNTDRISPRGALAAPGVRIHPSPPSSPSIFVLSENRSKSARVRAICDYAWTRRTSFTALFAGIKRKLSARDFARSTKIRSNFAFTEVDDAGALSVQRSGVSRFWPARLGDVPLLGLARLASRRWLTRWSPRLRLMPTPSAYKSACRQIS